MAETPPTVARDGGAICGSTRRMACRLSLPYFSFFFLFGFVSYLLYYILVLLLLVCKCQFYLARLFLMNDFVKNSLWPNFPILSSRRRQSKHTISSWLNLLFLLSKFFSPSRLQISNPWWPNPGHQPRCRGRRQLIWAPMSCICYSLRIVKAFIKDETMDFAVTFIPATCVILWVIGPFCFQWLCLRLKKKWFMLLNRKDTSAIQQRAYPRLAHAQD